MQQHGEMGWTGGWQAGARFVSRAAKQPLDEALGRFVGGPAKFDQILAFSNEDAPAARGRMEHSELEHG
ncbi:MAG TPA: hypothetical protein VFZ53_17920, partial [Polyangiaceae bacterium]